MRNFKIRSKVISMVLAVSIFSLSLFLLITRHSIKKEIKNSIKSINTLKEEAAVTSEQGLKIQAIIYLARLVACQASNSNYILNTIDSQVKIAVECAKEMWNSPFSHEKNNIQYKKLNESIDNYKLDFYYTLAPEIDESKVKSEITALGTLKPLFKSIISNNSIPLTIEEIYIASESGIFFNMSKKLPFDKKYDARKSNWYKSAKKNKKSGWSKIYFDNSSYNYIITYYSPIYDSKNNLKAVIGANISLNSLLNILSKQVKNIGEIFITNKEGVILNFSDLSDDMKEAIGKEKNLFKSNNKYIQTLAEKVKNNNNKEVYEFKINNTSRLAAYASVDSTSWSIVAVVYTDIIMTYVNKTRDEIDRAGNILTEYSEQSLKNTSIMLTFSSIFVFLIVLLISSKFADFIVKPLLKLIIGVEKLGKGDLNSKIEIKTRDEIEILANTYNKMTDDLKKYISDLKETTAAKERIEGELQVARRIQASMLPRVFPPFPNRKEFDIFGTMDPAKEVAGDYFDFFFITQNKFCFTIGDVSGKGITASLFMVISKIIVKTQGLRNISVDKVFTNANNTLAKDNDELMFTTSLLFIIDLKTGEIEYTNAGHNPPLLYRASENKFSYIHPKIGPVLGMMPGSKYILESDILKKGDILFLYTDGVSEAMDPDNKQYSEERLINKLNSIESRDVVEIEKIITNDLREFVRGAEQSDDITILIFKYN